MRESKSHTIDGHIYTVNQLGAKAGRLVFARVMRIVGAAAESESPVAKLASALTDAEVEYLCDTFAATTLVAKAESPQNQVPLKDEFDLHFAGRYGSMVRWLWAALETNFGSFFSDMGLNTEALAKAAKSAMSGTPLSPTAPSGASSSPASGG